jgi:DNA replication regulator DPB11
MEGEIVKSKLTTFRFQSQIFPLDSLTGRYSDKEHPLAGVVLCFTSILPEQRVSIEYHHSQIYLTNFAFRLLQSKLSEIAGQMGAVHKYDLTSDVTHLLVGETNTEKYKFVARERSDVLVLMPEWIEAVRQSWMDGGDTDLRALERKYRLPTFHGLSICVTGFEDRKCYQNQLATYSSNSNSSFVS